MTSGDQSKKSIILFEVPCFLQSLFTLSVSCSSFVLSICKLEIFKKNCRLLKVYLIFLHVSLWCAGIWEWRACRPRCRRRTRARARARAQAQARARACCLRTVLSTRRHAPSAALCPAWSSSRSWSAWTSLRPSTPCPTALAAASPSANTSSATSAGTAPPRTTTRASSGTSSREVRTRHTEIPETSHLMTTVYLNMW